jgi:hypothetical protein
MVAMSFATAAMPKGVRLEYKEIGMSTSRLKKINNRSMILGAFFLKQHPNVVKSAAQRKTLTQPSLDHFGHASQQLPPS